MTMLVHRRVHSKALAALITGAIAVAFAIIAAPPTYATYQYTEVCVVNHTSGTVQVTFFRQESNFREETRRNIPRGSQECRKASRASGPDVSLSIGYSAVFMFNNPAVGWPVIVAKLTSSGSSCKWDSYTSTCWYARLGQNQHRCLKERPYWLRPSREADSGGAKQFRVQVYDGSADPSSFGC